MNAGDRHGAGAPRFPRWKRERRLGVGERVHVRKYVACVAAVFVVSGCVPASPAPATYEDKAALTLGSALSEVATAQLALTQLDQGKMFRPAVLTTFRYSEDNLDTASKSFTELNPPPTDDRLYQRCSTVLGDAQDLLAQARIAVERQDAAQYPSLLRRLRRMSDRLDTFEKQVGS